MVNGLYWIVDRFDVNYCKIIVLGIVIVLFIGVGSWFFDCLFLIMWFDYFDILLVGKIEFVSVIVFDLGVYLIVVGVMLMILVSLGKLIVDIFK